MYVVGTAGHVDHGKSELVRALTGIHPDRLPEEKARQMTIDLGFAWFDLPISGKVGIVDVPGHRDFIENMLSGTGMVDAVLFIIAADEGVMPQTREHLAILDLLNIQHAVVVLTKVDLVQDDEWLSLVEDDVLQLLEGSSLANADVVCTSALTGEGMEALRHALDQVLKGVAPKPDVGRPRLHLDRSFHAPGFGTIVTGTLIDGSLEIGKDVEIAPPGLKGRIRALQSHQQDLQTAYPGSRVAVNIGGVERKHIRRGDTVIYPSTYEATALMDVRLRMLPDARSALGHNQSCKLFVGAAQRMVRIRVLGADEVLPGEAGWAQLALEEPVVAERGDRFILRRASPPETIGGGRVLNPHPLRRHRRYDMENLEQMKRYDGEAEDVLLATLHQYGPADRLTVFRHAALEEALAANLFDELLQQGHIVPLDEIKEASKAKLFFTARDWQRLLKQLMEEMESYHRAYPLRLGMPRQELRSKLKISQDVLAGVLARAEGDGKVVAQAQIVRVSSFQPEPTEEQLKRLNDLQARFDANPATPPAVHECVADIGEELFTYALQSGRFVRAAPDVAFSREAYERFFHVVQEMIETQGSLTVKDFRDRIGSTRKYAIAFLEHLNQLKLTELEDDRHLPTVPPSDWTCPTER